MEGDYDLVRRALDSSKKFGVEDADDMGITLLMYSAQNGKITDRIIWKLSRSDKNYLKIKQKWKTYMLTQKSKYLAEILQNQWTLWNTEILKCTSWEEKKNVSELRDVNDIVQPWNAKTKP